MNNDLSIIRLILEASPFVQFIMALLLLASISSWAIIIDKRRVLKKAVAAAQEFETSFWSGVDLNSLYREMARSEATPQGMAGIFEAGLSRVRQAQAVELGARAGHRRLAPRDARVAAARDGSARAQPRVPRDRQ